MEKERLFPRGKLVIYTDGGARGNPGPAAIGAVVGDRHYHKAIGETTNNVAEYKALIFAFQKAKQLLGKKEAKETEVEVRADSELMVSQLTAKYKVHDKDLIPLFIEAWNLMQDFRSISYKLIPREENKVSDALVNRALDTLLLF
ncbi:MAG: ribonuclease HI family protein [Candidatus Brennerbacteria bacterium]|nr:ribonuclease HI family protein [Candidatus Brennerbacteria bacterium]